MRRIIVHEYLSKQKFIREILEEAVKKYHGVYAELDRKVIIEEFEQENTKFQKTLKNGLKELDRVQSIDAPSAFKIYESYGLPYEIVKELGGERAAQLNRTAFDEEFKKHQELSRAGAEKKFGGHGLILDTGELKAGNEDELKKVLRLHTSTHLLQQALREVLGPEVHQMGSDITPERTRFDFSFPRKMTPEEIKKTEEAINRKIKEDLPMQFQEMPKSDAEKVGALHFFREKYPDPVKVYFVGHDLKSAWSKEFCGGPHVTHTGEIGHFRIAKEEAVGAGVRRIRGVELLLELRRVKKEKFLILEISPLGTNGLFLSVGEDRAIILEKFVRNINLKKFLKSPVRRMTQKSWEGEYLFKSRRK